MFRRASHARQCPSKSRSLSTCCCPVQSAPAGVRRELHSRRVKRERGAASTHSSAKSAAAPATVRPRRSARRRHCRVTRWEGRSGPHGQARRPACARRRREREPSSADVPTAHLPCGDCTAVAPARISPLSNRSHALHRRGMRAPIARPLARVVAQAPTAPKAATLDPVAVTASRTPQPIADLLADVTVIGADEIVRSGAQSLTELLQRQPGVEITINGGPGSTSGAFLRGANAGQTLVLIDGLRVGSSSVGATSLEAIPARPDRAHRDPARAGVEPVRRRCDRRRDPGVHQTRGGRRVRAQRWRPATAPTTRATRAPACAGRWVRCASRSQAGGTRSAASTRSKIPATSATTAIATAIDARTSAATPCCRGRRGRKSPSRTSSNRLNNAVRRRRRASTTARSRRSRRGRSASRNKLGERWTSTLTVGEGSDDSVSQTGFGDFPFKTHADASTLAERRHAAARRAVGDRSSAAKSISRPTRTSRSRERNTNSATGVYQLRYDAFALQANLRHDDSSQYGGKTTGGIALGYKLSPAWRFTAGYSTGFKAPSFNDLYFPVFSNPNLVPETSRNAEVGRVLDLVLRRMCAGKRARSAITTGSTDLIVFQCDADFNCVPQNVERATLERRDAGPRPHVARHARRRARSTCRIRRTIAPATCCRAGRASTARLRCCSRRDRCSSASNSSRRRCATTTRRTRSRWAATASST